jgi:hypothetical protein
MNRGRGYISRRYRNNTVVTDIQRRIEIVQQPETDFFYSYPSNDSSERFPHVNVQLHSLPKSERRVIPTQTANRNEHGEQLSWCRSNSRSSIYKGNLDRGVLFCENQGLRHTSVGVSVSEGDKYEVLKDQTWAPSRLLVTLDLSDEASLRRVELLEGPPDVRYLPQNPYVLRPCRATDFVQHPTEEWYDRVFRDSTHIIGGVRLPEFHLPQTDCRETVELAEEDPSVISERREIAKRIAKRITAATLSQGLNNESPEIPLLQDGARLLDKETQTCKALRKRKKSHKEKHKSKRNKTVENQQ